MKHLELFAGIGGFRRALDLLSEDGIMNFESIGFSEIDANAVCTYSSNYSPSKTEIALGDIVAFTSDKKNIQSLPDFELLTGGFPCQTFSMMGKREGFNEDRGQMFFRIMDILEIKRPNYVLLENVKNLMRHDQGRTFARIKEELEGIGYFVYPAVYNTSDYHLPQTRSRAIIFACKKRLTKSQAESFTPESVKLLFDSFVYSSSIESYGSVLDILDKDVDKKYYLSERIKPTILADGSANFRSKSEINKLIARPLTATMHKMHRACQDNYYSEEFILSDGQNKDFEKMSKDELAHLKIRRITPEEAFALQGFPKSFASEARQNGVSNGALYKQAGNAISVNTVYAIMYYLITKGIVK